MFIHSRHNGFTLVELLIGVAIISILSSLTILTINPVKYLGDAQTATELFQANQIDKALLRIYSAKGSLPNTDLIPTTEETAIAICQTGIDNYPACIDISAIVTESIIPELPMGSRAGIDTIGFSVYKDILGIAHVIITPEQE